MNSALELSPAEADQRVIRARQALARCEREQPAETDHLLTAEIGVLRDIAASHPGKAAKIADLIERMEAVRRS